MLHPLFVWASCTEHPVCSLRLRLFHTSQTAVASIAFCIRCREYVKCAPVRGSQRLLSHACLLDALFRIEFADALTRAPPARLPDLCLHGLRALARSDTFTL